MMARSRDLHMMEGSRSLMCLLLLGMTSLATAHVYMAVPIPRHMLDGREYNKGGKDGPSSDYRSICGDGGGATTVQFGTRGKFGIPAVNRLRAGEKFKITLQALAGHWGRFDFSICVSTGPETSANVNEECLNKHRLKAVPGQARITYPHGYLWLGDIDAGTISGEYYVPDDVRCDGVTTFCLLQMNYWSGTSCNPPDYCPTNLSFTKCSVHYKTCAPTAQRFRNCADIIVTGPKIPTPTTPTPVPSSTDCCTGKTDGLHANRKNCRLACRCRSGKIIKRLSCRVGYNFDEKKQKCRTAKVFRCR